MNVKWMALDHVQLAIPRGSEDACRAYFCGFLGWPEIEKPGVLAARGGVWLDPGPFQLHLGVDDDFRPAKKAHAGFEVDDVHALARGMEEAGHEVEWDDLVPGIRRFYTFDCVGNRLEFLQKS